MKKITFQLIRFIQCNVISFRALITNILLLIAIVGHAEKLVWPATDPDKWLLAFVDIETTGLIPGYHEMIDIGIVISDLEGIEIDELFLRIQPEFPERTDDGARAINAFDNQRWKDLGAFSESEAIERIITFHKEVSVDKNVLMVAYNSHFDLGFLDHLFRKQKRSWRELYHYYVLDLPSMAWSMGIRGLTGSAVSSFLGIVDETHIPEMHTGITGARFNADVYRALLDIKIKD